MYVSTNYEFCSRVGSRSIFPWPQLIQESMMRALETESCGVQDWQVYLDAASASAIAASPGKKALPMHSTFKSLLCEGVMCCRLFSNSAICLVREFSRQFWGVPPFHETSRDGDTVLIHQFVLRSLSLRLIQTLKTGFPKRKVVSQPPCFKVSQPPFFRGSVSFRECGTWALEKLTYCTRLLGEPWMQRGRCAKWWTTWRKWSVVGVDTILLFSLVICMLLGFIELW